VPLKGIARLGCAKEKCRAGSFPCGVRLSLAIFCGEQHALRQCTFHRGNRLGEAGQHRGAIVAYDHATKLFPSLIEAWFRAGALVYTLGHRDAAIGCFRRAAVTGGKTIFGRLGKAGALLIEDRNQEAEQVLRETLVADPKNAMASDLLGNLLSEFGRFDEARACFERAIAIAPLLAGSYYDLVRCRPVTSNATVCFSRWKPSSQRRAGSGATPPATPANRQDGGRCWRLRLGYAAFRRRGRGACCWNPHALLVF
jgi:Tetratricopeptide repeat